MTGGQRTAVKRPRHFAGNAAITTPTGGLAKSGVSAETFLKAAVAAKPKANTRPRRSHPDAVHPDAVLEYNQGPVDQGRGRSPLQTHETGPVQLSANRLLDVRPPGLVLGKEAKFGDRQER